MELVIFIGIPASGKSSFYQTKFFDTHIRINLDMLRTRHREKELFQKCIELKQKIVIDNTNPTIDDRKRYILPAKKNGYSVIGYYFRSQIAESLARNENRVGKKKISEVGVKSSYSRLQLPTFREGFDELFYVKIDENNNFIAESWQDEIQ